MISVFPCVYFSGYHGTSFTQLLPNSLPRLIMLNSKQALYFILFFRVNNSVQKTSTENSDCRNKNVFLGDKLSGYSNYMHHLFMHICLLALLHQIQCLPGQNAVSTAKGCISHHLNSHFSCMLRRSCMAWRTARHLCYVRGSKCPLFSPIKMIRLSLGVLRKNKPLALLSGVLSYGKRKPQETVLVLNHFRQSLAMDTFSKPC